MRGRAPRAAGELADAVLQGARCSPKVHRGARRRMTVATIAQWPAARWRKLMLNAAAYGGVVDGSMAQGQEGSYAAIKFDKQTKEGGCWALSAMWLQHQATSTGQWDDYFAWIKRPSGIKMMNNTQVKHQNRKESGESSKVFLKEVLSGSNFIIDDAQDHAEVDWPTNEAGVACLTTPATFKFINLQFGSGGHAIASRVIGATARFFDPNYGQATFNSLQNFRRWMVNELLPNYNDMFGLAWFRVTNVRRGIGPVKPIG
jgi:hypothetical protein